MKKKQCVIDVCVTAVLLLFSLRHVTWGLDLWDTGYNYANYTYASPKHLGTMWWFATYLTNLLGHFFTLLPYGNTLVGLNVYTGLLVGSLGVLGYFFAVRKLGISRLCTALGEMTALCLCWCPSAKLYDYLTYLFFLLCVIFLYEGLTGRKKRFLVLAGICLGTNIFVRFSNLPEAGLILAVWGYAFLEGLEKKERSQKTGRSWVGFVLAKAGGYTLWCLIGYLIPLIFGFGWIAVRYGIGEYAEGIRLLFAMTDTAADYSSVSMLYGMIWPFWEGKYWMVRILLLTAGVTLLAFFMDCVSLLVRRGKDAEKTGAVLSAAGTLGGTALMIYWLCTRKKPSFTSLLYKSYDPIFWPGTMFLTLGLCISLVRIFHKNSSKQERLLAGLVLLVIPITSLGSNNGLYPSFNNLFLAAPYILHEMIRFTGWAYERSQVKQNNLWKPRLSLLPTAFAGWALIALLMFQFGMFGLQFAFCEGTGVQECGYRVDNNRVLKGVEMSCQRAQWLSEISEFANENYLAGQEVILYGGVPSLSFYLEMPPAFHAWANLASYQYSTMQKAVEELAGEIREKEREKPVVIAEKQYADPEVSDPKWLLVRQFMGQYGYEKTFENEKFVIWQAE